MSAATDFDPGPEAFTRAATRTGAEETHVDSVLRPGAGGGEKTNGSGDAIASNFNRDGTSQHGGLGPRRTP